MPLASQPVFSGRVQRGNQRTQGFHQAGLPVLCNCLALNHIDRYRMLVTVRCSPPRFTGDHHGGQGPIVLVRGFLGLDSS